MDWDEFVAATLPEPDTISLEALQGTGARGEVYAAGVDVTQCVVQGKRRRVRVSTQEAAGAVVVSELTVYGPPTLAAACPVGSRVTPPGGTARKVLTVQLHEALGLALPEHTEITLE